MENEKEDFIIERSALAEEWMARIIDYCAARDLGYDMQTVVKEAYDWADVILDCRKQAEEMGQ